VNCSTCIFISVQHIYLQLSPCLQVGDEDSGSKANVGEAAVVMKHVAALMHVGLKPSEVAIVTPYNAQVTLLKGILAAAGVAGIEVSLRTLAHACRACCARFTVAGVYDVVLLHGCCCVAAGPLR